MLSRPILPEEILIHIFNFLKDQKDFMNVSLCSKQFNTIARTRYNEPLNQLNLQKLSVSANQFVADFIDATKILLSKYLPINHLHINESCKSATDPSRIDVKLANRKIDLRAIVPYGLCEHNNKHLLMEPIREALKGNNCNVYPFVFNHILASLLVNLFPRNPKIMAYAKRWLVKQFPVLLVIDDCEGAYFSSLNFSGTDLSNTFFINADLTGANLQGATIFGCKFNSADLTRANLSKISELENVDLSQAKLIGTVFSPNKKLKLKYNTSFSKASVEKAYKPWIEAAIDRKNYGINTIQWVETPGFCLAPKPRSFTDLELKGKAF